MIIPNAIANPADIQEIPVNNIDNGDKSDATLVNNPVITAIATGIAKSPDEINAIEANTAI